MSSIQEPVHIYIWGTRQEFDSEQVKNFYDTIGREEDAARFNEIIFLLRFCVCVCGCGCVCESERGRERDGSLVWLGVTY